MKQCMYQQNTSPEKGCYYENKNHSIMFMECKTANCYYKQLKRLQAENEKLKNIIKTHNPWYRCKNCNKDYKQALEEIREDLEQDTTCESRECGCDDYGECLKCVKETILDKIKEVLK